MCYIFVDFFAFHSSVIWMYVLLEHCTMHFLWCLTVPCKFFACKFLYALPLFCTDHLSLLILSLTQDNHCSSLNMFRLSAVGPPFCERVVGQAVSILPIKFLFKTCCNCYIPTLVPINNCTFFLHEVHKINAHGEIRALLLSWMNESLHKNFFGEFDFRVYCLIIVIQH